MVKHLIIITFIALLSVIGIQGALDCEELAIEDCAYSVSGKGSRCVLEKRVDLNKNVVYECQTSPVMAERSEPWIETDECISSCGLERMSVGMSTDGMVNKEFLSNWCSPACQENCPNVIDLFTKLAAGEDIHLPHICSFLRPSSRKLIGTLPLAKGTRQAIDSLEVAAQAPISAAAAPVGALSPEGALSPLADDELQM